VAFKTEARERGAVTQRQNREARLAEKTERQNAAGIPDSKPFGGSAEALDNPVLDCHVAGVLVRDLPIEVQTKILWQQTDEGIGARNEGKSGAHVSVTVEPWQKALDQRRDDVKHRDMDSYEARDPLKEVADAHAKPGMRPKFLSARKVKENGGTGDYEVVKDDKGDPVTVRGMVLGQMPEERAKARNRHFQQRGNRILQEMTERFKTEGGKTAVVDQ